MKTYGAPYKGSKRRHCEEIIDIIPPADSFIDACAGGGAVAHCAAASGKFNKVTANEIIPGQARILEYLLVKREKLPERRVAVADKDDFFACVERFWAGPCSLDEAVVAVCLSFGNDLRTYLYGEPHGTFKRAVATMLSEPSLARRISGFYEIFREIAKKGPWPDDEFERYKRLDHMARFMRLKNAPPVKAECAVLNKSLFDIDYNPYDIVFFDPPYPGTSGYARKTREADKTFDFASFWELVDSLKDKAVFMTTPTCESKTMLEIKRWDFVATVCSGQGESMNEGLWGNQVALDTMAAKRENVKTVEQQFLFGGENTGAAIAI